MCCTVHVLLLTGGPLAPPPRPAAVPTATLPRPGPGLPADNLLARRAAPPAPLRDLHRLVLASFAATGAHPAAAHLAACARAHGVNLRPALGESLRYRAGVHRPVRHRGVPFAAGTS